VKTLRPGHRRDRDRCDADRQHVERAGRDRLDGGGAGIEFGEADIECRRARPAGAVEHVERGRADDGDVADANGKRALPRAGAAASAAEEARKARRVRGCVSFRQHMEKP
jgi:hypothetical protein